MIDLNQHKIELTYPCNWKYKIIIRFEENIDLIIKSILKDREYSILESNRSSKGKFHSFSLNLEVQDEEDRLNLYKNLQEHKQIKMVV
jgi:putative lipoic acid-binding regulatory protein